MECKIHGYHIGKVQKIWQIAQFQKELFSQIPQIFRKRSNPAGKFVHEAAPEAVRHVTEGVINMDNFAEYMVKKRPDSSDNLKKIGIIALAAILCIVTTVLAFLIKIPFILIITCALIYGAYFLLSNLSVEYEYAVTNGEVDVDKIIARRKRVHLITVQTADFEAFGPLTDDVPDDDSRTLVLCADNTSEGEYYADLTTEDYGETRIIFTPNQAVLEAIQAALPRKLRRTQQ